LHYEKFQDGTVKCIEDELPFEIPSGWEWCRLSNICLILNGDRGKNYPAKNKLHTEGIPFVSASNISDGEVSEDGLLYLSDEQFDLLGAGKLQLNDIVFCIRGSLGKCGFFSMEKGAIASSLVIVRALDNKEYLNGYLYNYLNSLFAADEIHKYDNGSAQPNLAAKDFQNFLVPLPAYKEIRKITEKCEELLINESTISIVSEELKNCIDITKTKILDLAIRGKLIPQDSNDEPASILLERIRAEKEELIKQGKLKRDKKESIIFKGDDNSYYELKAEKQELIDEILPFEIPNSWTWCRLGSICTEIMYGLSNSAETHGSYRFLRITDIQNGKVNWNKVPYTTTDDCNKYLLKENDIVFARTGATVGKSYLIKDIPVESVFASYLIRIRLLPGIDANYIYDFFNSPFYWKQITDKAVGVGQPNCNGTLLQELLIPIPPLNEQLCIHKKVFLYNNEISNIEANLE
ncbi:MAG: restriction endonuclease subunit S, partial [Lactobacillus sp.]|nr:restriction endonuclease subunit S [Lactobacillus sp.]